MTVNIHHQIQAGNGRVLTPLNQQGKHLSLESPILNKFLSLPNPGLNFKEFYLQILLTHFYFMSWNKYQCQICRIKQFHDVTKLFIFVLIITHCKQINSPILIFIGVFSLWQFFLFYLISIGNHIARLYEKGKRLGLQFFGEKKNGLLSGT